MSLSESSSGPEDTSRTLRPATPEWANGGGLGRSPSDQYHRPPPKYETEDYEPLPRDRKAIRLLDLLPSGRDNPQVEGELVIFSNKDNVNYEALSWYWGDEEPNKYISIRKGRQRYAKWIKPNLFSALRNLRHDQNNRYLWVDAVCIDQENLTEKNHQVEMMFEIYGKAKRVCIWLGDPTPSSRIAIKFIKEQILQLQDFDDLCDDKHNSPKWRALLDLMQRRWFSRRWVVQEVSLARKAVIYCGTDKISWNKFAIAVELFVEVETATHRLSEVMKKDPTYYHVPGWFEYVSALGASLLVDATGRLFRDYKERHGSRPPALYARDSDQTMDSGLSSDSELGSDSETEVPLPSSSRTKNKNRGQPLLSLEYLVSSLSIFEASVEHDTIFALLAISKDCTPIAASEEAPKTSKHVQDMLEVFTQRKRYNVDYELPYVDVCKEFIQFCIKRSIKTDPARALDVLCRPWATEEKTLAERRRRNDMRRNKARAERQQRELRMRGLSPRSPQAPMQNGGPPDGTADQSNSHDILRTNEDQNSNVLPLPSWVPQLSGAPYSMYSQAGTGMKMGRKNADTLVGLPSMTQRNYNAAETKQIDIECLKFRKRPDDPKGNFKGHFSMYVKGFVLDEITEVQHSSQSGCIPQDWAELGGWRDPLKTNPPDAFWRTLVADRGRDGKNPPVYYSRACKTSFKKGGFESGSVNTTDLINNGRNSVVAQFCRRVQAAIWNRALAKTKTDKLGLVARNVHVGDLVCIFYGCSVPVILRQSERKSAKAFEAEIEWELRHLHDNLKDGWQKHRKRVCEFNKRKNKAKKEFQKWDASRRELWKKDHVWRQAYQNRRQKEPYPSSESHEETTHIPMSEYEARLSKRLKERVASKDASRLRHIMFLGSEASLRIGREFDAWKRDRGAEAKARKQTDSEPPGINWSKFELRFKWFRVWKRKVQGKKEAMKKEFEQEWEKKSTAHGQTRHGTGKGLPTKPLETVTDQRTPQQSPGTVSQPKPDRLSSDSRLKSATNGDQLHRENANAPQRSQSWPATSSTRLRSAWMPNPELTAAQKKRLQPSDKVEYDRSIRDAYAKRIGDGRPRLDEQGKPDLDKNGKQRRYPDDGYRHYQFLGECYIHGMMDGEAMAYQNKESIPSQLFELR